MAEGGYDPGTWLRFKFNQTIHIPKSTNRHSNVQIKLLKNSVSSIISTVKSSSEHGYNQMTKYININK